MTRVANDQTQHTVHFWPKKMGKSGEGSSRVVISQPQWQLLSKAHNVFLVAPSPIFPKRNRHPYPKSPDDQGNKVTCKCIEFLIDSIDVTLVYKDDLQLKRRRGGSGSAESSKKNTHTLFRGWKSESVVIQTDMLLLSDLVCIN